MATTVRTAPAGHHARPRTTVAGVLLGLGLGGLIDGIVLHQILQWHHMGTSHGESADFPRSTVKILEDNTLWDGLFHLSAYALVVLGLFLLWRSVAAGHRASWRALTGLLLAGWGLFDLIEGLVDHQILGIHHVRDDLGGPLSWDLGFLALGAVLVVVGVALWRSDQPARDGVEAGPAGAAQGRSRIAV